MDISNIKGSFLYNGSPIWFFLFKIRGYLNKISYFRNYR